MTDSLLAFARRQSLRAEWVDLNVELKEFQPLLLQALGETIHFSIVGDPRLPLCRVDSTHFQSAILNLAINARDAMPDGGLFTITTGFTMLGKEDLLENPDANPGRFVTVSVQDTGSGMSDAVMAKVFEPFFTTKEIGKGSGLGLSQVFGFVRQSGGHVSLHSTPGTGTCVTICLPAPEDVQGGSVVEKSPRQARRAELRDVGVLVVEDDTDVLRVIAACLADAGCRVRTTQTVQEALKLLRENDDIQCLLSDVALRGDRSGIQLACLAREMRPDLSIILATGHADVPSVEHEAVTSDFQLLRKPILPEELLSRISETIATGVSRHPA